MSDKLNYNFEPKERQRFLIDKFLTAIEADESLISYSELNGNEGLIVYMSNGKFVQFKYTNKDVWNISIFPYDIYSRKEFINGEWKTKQRW